MEGGNVQALEDLFYCVMDVDRIVIPRFSDEVDRIGLEQPQ
jgi:hypothetical protein